ncbi:MAG: hypothetical protein ABJB95_06965 [Gemmatimonadales bacterium]
MEGTNSKATRPDEVNDQSGFGKSVVSSVRHKASNLPAMIADGLEAGAEALRKQRQSTAVVSEGPSVGVTTDASIDAVTDTLATGMQSSADWIRDADLDKLKAGVEKQVKEHPARSLLVALGAGYLIGKIFRR